MADSAIVMNIDIDFSNFKVIVCFFDLFGSLDTSLSLFLFTLYVTLFKLKAVESRSYEEGAETGR